MNKKDLIKLRDAEAEKYKQQGLVNSWRINFCSGWDTRDNLGDEALKIAVEALEFYSKIENFEKVVWQDEDKSGPCEPYDFDENELVERYWDGGLGDFGIKAEEALAEIRKLMTDNFYPEPGGQAQPNNNDNPPHESDEAW